MYINFPSNGKCPHCGYCPHCGRSNHSHNPFGSPNAGYGQIGQWQTAMGQQQGSSAEDFKAAIEALNKQKGNK